MSSERLEQVLSAIREQPDITLQELKDKFSLPVSLSALSKTIRSKLELCYKKTVYPVEQHQEDVRIKRETWKSEQPKMAIDNLVFIDESSIDTGMTRLYGRGASNERVVDHIPDTRFERTTILSSIRANGDMVPLVFEGSLNGELFKEYVAQCLGPTLKTGDIVVMDNLSSHKVEGVMEPSIAAGATIRYLPPYSPDLNPNEMVWSKIKAYLRKAKARTKELMEDAIADALNLIEVSDILGWFAEVGYSTR